MDTDEGGSHSERADYRPTRLPTRRQSESDRRASAAIAATERIYQLMTLESGIPFWQVTISRLPSAVAAACTRIARRFPEPCYGPNLVRNSGAATGHAESGAGISPCRTRAMNRYATSLIPAGTIRPTTAITRQTPPRRSKIWRTAEDRVKIRPWVVSTRMLGGKVCLRSHATSD